ncbi:TetR/AcrR family transcriptional regulator [Apilactobacillus kunkeei]|uniref:TetR/AcrR family transcriptional regulator n=1 Tax=Apilactobacillus kunkeei TaxID=148814 RepID=UPI00112A7377|nr:TetR/AcrR family transcriptional regulator [Apilactobacillus kunkeei]TPR54992.1 TetR/AcrR family transcriptional regulator [Apilactobacillus kunkeei]
MPTQTFLNLNEDKQNQVFNALIKEFSDHRLMDAQVARIIKDCSIARGSFYKYFDDINDSYQYVLKRVLRKVHFDVFAQLKSEPTDSLHAFYVATESFINKLKDSDYEQFYRQYVLFNQYELKHVEYDYNNLPDDKLILVVDGQKISDRKTIILTYKWASRAAHQTIRTVLNRGDEKQALSDFANLLKLINRGLVN